MCSQTPWILCEIFPTAISVITAQIILQWVVFLTNFDFYNTRMFVLSSNIQLLFYFLSPAHIQVVILQKCCDLLLFFWNCLYVVVRSVIRWQQTNSLQETECPPVVQVTYQHELPFYFWSLPYPIELLVMGLMTKTSKSLSLIKEQTYCILAVVLCTQISMNIIVLSFFKSLTFCYLYRKRLSL